MRRTPGGHRATRSRLVALALALVGPLVVSLPMPAAEAKPTSPAPPVIGSPAWHRALLAGASTEVPVDPELGWADVDGNPFSVRTRITAVQFHRPGVPSGVPGGLSATPTPVRRSALGIDYWQVSGELSAQIVDAAGGIRGVVGPIGPDGVDHRFDADRSHPRGQLPGALFVLRWPAKGFNGRMVDHQAPGDGGFHQPGSALLHLPVDQTALLDRGYALWTVSLAGSVPLGEVDGEEVVDTNPDSGTGIFWHGYPDVRSYLRAARIADDDTETAFPEDFTNPLWVPGEGWVEDAIGDPDFFYDVHASLQEQPQLARDGVVIGKRLAQQLIGTKTEPWTAFLGWSGSGGTATVLGMGTPSGPLQLPPDAGVPDNGGNFNRYQDPSSGVRFDAFLSHAPARFVVSFIGDEEFRDLIANEAYPVGAPMVWVDGDLDVLGFVTNSVHNANEVARKLPASRLAGTPIEQLVALYDLADVGHAPRDFVFANEPSRPAPADALRYQRRGTYPEGSSQSFGDGGSPVQPAMIEANAEDPWIYEDDWFFRFTQDIPRTTPFFLQQLENLYALTTRGTPMPTSNVEGPLFGQLDSIESGTPYPLVPRPCDPVVVDTGPFVIGQGMEACAAGIEEDAVIELADPQTGEVFTADVLEPRELDELRWFADHNPLDHVVGSIEVPDTAAPLGPRLVMGQYQIQRWLPAYDSHRAWARAFATATRELERARLWDRELGRRYLQDAERSEVLR